LFYKMFVPTTHTATRYDRELKLVTQRVRLVSCVDEKTAPFSSSTVRLNTDKLLLLLLLLPPPPPPLLLFSITGVWCYFPIPKFVKFQTGRHIYFSGIHNVGLRHRQAIGALPVLPLTSSINSTMHAP
jgi:hypothetical protein